MLKKLTEKRWIITISLAVFVALMMVFWLIFTDCDINSEAVREGLTSFAIFAVAAFILVRISGFLLRMRLDNGWTNNVGIYGIYGKNQIRAWCSLVIFVIGFILLFFEYIFHFNQTNWMVISACASGISGLLFDMNKNYW